MCSSAERVCHIVSGGDLDPTRFHPAEGDFVIAADCGYRYLKQLGFVPDLTLGDFDSLGAVPDEGEYIRLPAEKDDTDTLYAVRVGLEKGYTRFLIHGALGGDRFDHSLANVQTLLFLASQGAEGRLLGGDGTVIAAVRNGTFCFEAERTGYLSVFCMGERAEGVSLSGVRYPLHGTTITNDFPIGVSNEFTGVSAKVEVQQGILLLIWKE